jgi:aerobic carbon-monoxide dehydrogenase large subunit
MGGAAVKLAGRKLRATMQRLAGHALEVAPDDLDFADGRFSPRGNPDRGITVEEIARLAYSPSRLPPGEDVGLQAVGTYLPTGRPFTYGAHVAVVEVFPETGQLQILKYVIVDDCGVVINPLIVTGQIHGGVAQGLAGALYEELVYDDAGQLLNASFMDYLMPTAMEVPPMVLGHLDTPSSLVPGGMKGVGESGTISPPAALANAVCDALRPLGVSLHRTPLSPDRIWAAAIAAGRNLVSETS